MTTNSTPPSAAFIGYKDLTSGIEARKQLHHDLTAIFSFIHQFNVRAGWWSDLTTGQPKVRNTPELLMLTVSELGEAMEGHRKNLTDDKLPDFPMFTVEVQDAIIRLCDIAGSRMGSTTGTQQTASYSALACVEKIEFNFSRSDHSKASRQAPGGKVY